MTLVDRLVEIISAVPAYNTGYIAVRRETLGDLIDSRLIRQIAVACAGELDREVQHAATPNTAEPPIG